MFPEWVWSYTYMFPEWVLSYTYMFPEWVLSYIYMFPEWVLSYIYMFPESVLSNIYICFQNEFWVIYIYVSRMSFELYLYVSRMSFNNSSYQNDNKWKILFITWPLSGSYLKGVIETYSYWLNITLKTSLLMWQNHVADYKLWYMIVKIKLPVHVCV